MYKLLKSGVQRLADGACIPPTMDNRDWVEYQQWLKAGNTPLLADPAPLVISQPTVTDVIAALTSKGILTQSDVTAAMTSAKTGASP